MRIMWKKGEWKAKWLSVPIREKKEVYIFEGPASLLNLKSVFIYSMGWIQRYLFHWCNVSMSTVVNMMLMVYHGTLQWFPSSHFLILWSISFSRQQTSPGFSLLYCNRRCLKSLGHINRKHPFRNNCFPQRRVLGLPSPGCFWSAPATVKSYSVFVLQIPKVYTGSTSFRTPEIREGVLLLNYFIGCMQHGTSAAVNLENWLDPWEEVSVTPGTI